MHLGRFTRMASQSAGVAVVAATLALAACGSTSGAGGSKTIVIGSDLPISGADAGVGLPTQLGVQLAADQNKDLGNGYTLKYISKDDVSTTTGKHDPATGASNLAALLNDKAVAVIGPFNSNVAKQEIPVANNSTITLISPSNTNPGLTLQQYAADNSINFSQLHPSGKPNCYFRIPGNDVVQGKILADFATAPKGTSGLGFKKAYIIDDNEVYGVGLANFFVAEFKAQGGTTLGRDSIDSSKPPTSTLADKIKATKPDFVFYGGVTDGGGGTLKALLGASVPMVGGDGIAQDTEFTKAAGAAAAANTYGSVAAPETTKLTSSAATDFIAAYKKAFPDKNLVAYSGQAYDAAKIEIQAIKTLLDSGKTVTKESVCSAVQSVQYTGVTGTISFDQNGDNAGQRVFSIYSTDAQGVWNFVNQVNG